jgi:DNA primase
MHNFDDFVEKVRDANPIEDVIQASEFGGLTLKGHGRLRTAVKHDSLKVRTDMGRFFWYSKNIQGDVFEWVMKHTGKDFNEALEILAKRANLPMPKFEKVNDGELLRQRATADAFSVAAHVFQRWLWGDEEKGIKADVEALAYCRERGWTDETIKLSLKGFSGRKTDEQYKDMRGEFSLYGIDPLSLGGVAVLGFTGDVQVWATKQEVIEHPDFDPEWISKGRIHGLMDVPGLIYAHQFKGGVNYLSRRHLPGFDIIKDKDSGKEREWKSFNPYKLLAGPKQMYFNFMHRVDKPLLCFEGQGDADSAGQLGFGAVAFCGLMGEISFMAPEDAERLRKMARYINKHPAVTLFLDDDEAGQKATRQAAHLLGMKVQIGRMSRLTPREEAVDVSN